MNIQQLIVHLMQIPDQTLPVYCGDSFPEEIEGQKELTMMDFSVEEPWKKGYGDNPDEIQYPKRLYIGA